MGQDVDKSFIGSQIHLHATYWRYAVVVRIIICSDEELAPARVHMMDKSLARAVRFNSFEQSSFIDGWTNLR